MTHRFILLILLFVSVRLTAQNTEFSDYNWSTFPEPGVIDTVKPVNGSLITLERRINEVYANAEGNFEEILVYHRKIRLTTNEALNDFNKIYIPVDNVIEVIRTKARFISQEGKITELPESSIRQIENLDNKGNFKTFAIEGATIGGEIEYFYTLRKKFNAHGTVTIQGEEPRTNVDVIFAFPSKIEYLIKSYNGFPDFISRKDTLRETSYLETKVQLIPSLKPERYAAYKAGLMRFEYTLAYNSFNSNLRVYSFSKVSNNVYNNVFSFTKAEKSVLKSYLKKINLGNPDLSQNIHNIEDKVKSEIVISEELDETPSIDEMIRIKQTNEFGAIRFMVGLLSQAGINFELVGTCDKNERAFDPDFNGWNYLDDYIIYFPELKQYILPDNINLRLGVNASQYQGAFGLFLKPFHYGKSLSTLTYDVRQLPMDSYEQTTDSLLVNLKADLDDGLMNANIHRVFTGELASYYQSIWQLVPQENQKELMSPIFSMANQQTNISDFTLSNARPSDIGRKPLVWDVNLTANSLVEQAGNDILIKIGETIGEQAEMYQPSERKLPVVVNEVHNYYRRIVFEIPEGYNASGLEELNLNVELVNNGKISCCFTSWFELLGNKLCIYSKEYYTESGYPAARFEEFRKVINAAADFNKRTIILTKK